MNNIEYFPDGTIISNWFKDYSIPSLDDLGKKYILTDYDIKPDSKIYTKEIQNLIDLIYENGGGVLVVPEGTFNTGALNFKNGVNLYICRDGILKGSDDINDYEIKETRIEGETCLYYTALINVDNVDGFKLMGEGTIDGNGHKAWKAFWQRRKWNPECKNKDEQRPRLLYISNSKNVLITGVRLINSHFWTTHLYKCQYVKYINCYIYSPVKPVKAPSTDAIDIDYCSDILVKNCYLEVNDDSVVLKGGKGPWADKDSNNGANERIIVEDCEYGFCHSCLTCGSESIYNRNIIMRRVKVNASSNLLWLKMRPDTPQHYEHILIEDVDAKVTNFIHIRPWTQFFDLKGRNDIPMSYADNITIRNTNCDCTTFFNVKRDDTQYRLSNFTFSNLNIKTYKDEYDSDIINNMFIDNLNIEKKVL